MAKQKSLRKSDFESLQFIRWVLFLVVSAEAAGIDRLTRQRLHSLLFSSFASSQFYSINPLRKRAQRTKAGPYYRAAHMAIGRLALSGLVEVSEFSAHPSPKDLQFDAVFRPTKEGLSVCARLRGTLNGASIYRFLLDLCLSMVNAVPEATDPIGAQDDLLESVLDGDLSYKAALLLPGDVLAISQDGGGITPTVGGLNRIDEHLSELSFFNSKDVLFAYQKIIRGRVA